MSETGSGVGDGDDAGVAAATAGMGLSVMPAAVWLCSRVSGVLDPWQADATETTNISKEVNAKVPSRRQGGLRLPLDKATRSTRPREGMLGPLS